MHLVVFEIIQCKSYMCDEYKKALIIYLSKLSPVIHGWFSELFLTLFESTLDVDLGMFITSYNTGKNAVRYV